jgi:hypothetical protein
VEGVFTIRGCSGALFFLLVVGLLSLSSLA